MKNLTGFFTCLLLASSCWSASTEFNGTVDKSWAPPGSSVYDELNDNVWYLTTADQAANLYVTELGQGPPVVVLHGGPGNDFNYLIDAVRPQSKHFRFVLFDQRGSLLSPVPEAQIKQLKFDTLVDDLETLRIALRQPKLTILAHSFGTLLALRYYERYPDHVERLVLCGSVPPFSAEGGLKATMSAAGRRIDALRARPEVASVLKAEGLDGDISKMRAKQAAARNRITGAASFDLVHVERWRLLQGFGVFYNDKVDDAVGDSAPASYDIRPTQAAHPIPISLIQGDQDYIDPASAGWRSVKVKIHVIPQASHYAWIDNAAAFDDALRQSLMESTR